MSKLDEALSRQLVEAKNELKLTEEKLNAEKTSFANSMKANVGEDIKSTLSSIPKEPEKKKKEAGWLKRFFNKIVRTCS